MPNTRRPARLILADGTELHGRSFGHPDSLIGELVFNTSITGYQEILTDPSYRGQTVLLTQPHIGNYGVNQEDEESAKLWLSGLIVRECSRRPSNFRAAVGLPEYLRQHRIPAIERVDTRMLVRKVREAGAMNVMLTEDLETPLKALLEQVRAAPSTSDVDHVSAVTLDAPTPWSRGHESIFSFASPEGASEREPLELLAIDFGAKRNILRSLVATGFRVTVVPAGTTAEEILERKPQGFFLSNGPGDPAILDYAVRTTRSVVEAGIPTFGICLGHQILSQVFGAETYKMKFGHHGGNQPVMD